MSPHVPGSQGGARATKSISPASSAAVLTAEEVPESEQLARIAQRLAAAGTDLAACWDVLATGADELVSAAGALVARIEGDTFRIEAASGSLVPMTGFQAPLAGSLAADAVARGAALVLNDATRDLRVGALSLSAFEPRQVVIAPMMVAEQARGFVLALNSARGAFTGTDGARLQRIADHGVIALCYADRMAESQQAADEARALSEVVQQMNQSLEFERVVSLLAQHAAQLLSARGARVALFEEGHLATMGTFGDAADVVGAPADIGRVYAGHAIRQRRTSRTTDLRLYADQWARAAEPGETLPAGEEGRANGVAAPLLIGGRAIGAVTVFGNEARDFTDHDEARLLALADHAAVAIENARLYRAAAYTARHAHALAAVARALAFSATTDAVYAGISQVVRDALGAEGFTVILADPDARTVEVVHTEGAGAAIRWSAARFWDVAPGRVAASGVPHYATTMDTVFAQLTPEEMEAFQAGPVRSMAMLPLPGERTQRGVLLLRFASVHRFDDHERRLLEDFATQVAIAIRNAQLTTAERSGREREQAMADTVHQTEKMAAVGELVAGVAHELNNPLTGISTFAQLLLEDPLGEEQRESVRTIKREADRAVGVIRDLLAFSRKTGPRVVAVDFNALVTQTLRLRSYSLQTAGIDVQSILDPELPEVAGDDQRFQQVLLNLVVNAEYAMHRRDTRRLTVRTSRAGAGAARRAIVEISDTGTGMSPDLLNHIFEPFFTTKPAGVGTGLGLSVSFGIVQAHGGTISAHSTPGVGSTFTIELPVRVQTATSPAGRRQRSAAPPGAAGRMADSSADPDRTVAASPPRHRPHVA